MTTSKDLYARAVRVMPGGVSSSIRALEQDPPLFLARAQGAFVWDEEGRRYIDHVCGFGAQIFGAPPAGLVAAMQAAMAKGWQHGGASRLEVEAAEAVVSCVPSLEQVRFHGSATEALQTAFRIARAATGRRTVVKFARHYHGWVLPTDAQIAQGHAATEPQDFVLLPWNDPEVFGAFMQAHGAEIAAVVTEPMMANQGCFLPAPGWLEGLQAGARAAGALFILDETVTGFRLGLGGMQGMLGLAPDLSVFGKALGGGAPLGLVGGRRDLMALLADGRVGHGGTFNGSGPSMAAAIWTVAELRRRGPSFFASIAARGEALQRGLQEAAARSGLRVVTRGQGAIFWLAFDEADPTDVETPLYRAFRLALRRRGVRTGVGGRWYVSDAHGAAEIAAAIATAARSFAEV